MRPRLLFVHLHPSSFVRDDLEILSRVWDVRVLHFRGGSTGSPARRAASLAGAFVAQFFRLLQEVPRADCVYGWFADYHLVLPVFLARLWRRPAVIVLGGFDANHLPELGYGVFHSRWRAPLARFVVRRAGLLLAVTPGLIEDESRFATWPTPRRNGIRVHVPDLRTPIEVLPTGFDPAAWPPGPDRRERSVCTVGGIGNDRTLRIKGLDLFFETARLLPAIPFLVVGVEPREQADLRERHHPPDNVRFLGPVPREALAEIYARTSVYLQLSRTEGGLPMVLGEAMLCGCIPVASAVGGMPGTVGEAGFLVEAPDPADIAGIVRRALDLGDDPDAGPRARARARERIVTRFPREERARRLLEILGRVAGRAPSATSAPSRV